MIITRLTPTSPSIPPIFLGFDHDAQLSWSIVPHRVPNFSAIGQSACELSRFNHFQFQGRCPPSWILQEVDFNHTAASSDPYVAAYQIRGATTAEKLKGAKVWVQTPPAPGQRLGWVLGAGEGRPSRCEGPEVSPQENFWIDWLSKV